MEKKNNNNKTENTSNETHVYTYTHYVCICIFETGFVAKLVDWSMQVQDRPISVGIATVSSGIRTRVAHKLILLNLMEINTMSR